MGADHNEGSRENVPMPVPVQRAPYRSSKVSRRRLLGGAAGTMLALAAGWSPAANSNLSHFQPDAADTSWLLVIPDARESGYAAGNEVAIFGPDGEELTRFDHEGIVGSNTMPTGDPRRVVTSTWDGGLQLLHLDQGMAQMIDAPRAGDSLVFVDDPRGTFGAGGQNWSIVSILGDLTASASESQLFLVDFEKASGVDIWPRVADERDFPTLEHRFSASGRYLTLWDDVEARLRVGSDFELKGRAWLVPTGDPVSARPLDVGRSGWLSTAATFSPDERFIAYSAFAPDDLMGNLFIEPISGGDAIELAKGNAFSRMLWLPGQAHRLLSVGHGEVRLHQIDKAGSVTTDFVAECALVADSSLGLDPSGAHAVVGAKYDGPVAWMWCDLARGEVTDLPQLDGLAAYSTSGINTWPRWRLFGPQWPDQAPIVALDLETSETFQVIDLADRPADIATSADGRVVVLGTEWDDTHPARLVDLASRAVTPLRTDRSHMFRSGIVSPDGARAAVHSVKNDDHAIEVLLLDTSEPTSMQPLSTGAAMLWTSES